MLTRPDTWQDSHGQLGKSRIAKNTCNSKTIGTDRLTNAARCRVACLRLKNVKNDQNTRNVRKY